MSTPFVTHDLVAFRQITRGIAKRAAARPRPPLLHRLFPSLAPHERRERVVRISPTETIHSNPPFLHS